MSYGHGDIEESWEHDTAGTNQGAEDWFPQPIPVKIQRDEVENVAPSSVSLMSYGVAAAVNVAGTGAARPTQIATHKYHRYKCKFVWNIPAATTVYIANNETQLSGGAFGTAFQLITGQQMPDYDGQQPLYAVFTGTGPVTVSVMDESYKRVQ